MRAIHLFVSLSLLLGAGPCVPVKAGTMPAEAGIHGGRVMRSGDRLFELVFTPEQRSSTSRASSRAAPASRSGSPPARAATRWR